MKQTPAPESIHVHSRNSDSTVISLDHGATLGVPIALIGRLPFGTLGFYLKLLGLPKQDVADMLRLYEKMEPDTLEHWLDELRKAGYVWRKRRPDATWQYVISRHPLDEEGAMLAFRDQDRAIAAGEEAAQ